jgi:hypothetical protein
MTTQTSLTIFKHGACSFAPYKENTVKPALNRISKDPENFSTKARFPFNQAII